MHNRNKFQFWVWPSRFHGIHFICCEHINNSMNEFSSRILIFNLSNIQTQICKYHDLLSDVQIYFLLEYWSSIYLQIHLLTEYLCIKESSCIMFQLFRHVLPQWLLQPHGKWIWISMLELPLQKNIRKKRLILLIYGNCM